MNASVFVADFRWQLADRGELYLTGTYTQSDAAMDSWQMAAGSDVPLELFPDGLPGPGEDHNSPIEVHDYDFSQVDQYSDLDYDEIRATLGINYQLGAAAKLFGAVSLYDLDDSQPYLQDASGSVTLVTGGVTWSF